MQEWELHIVQCDNKFFAGSNIAPLPPKENTNESINHSPNTTDRIVITKVIAI